MSTGLAYRKWLGFVLGAAVVLVIAMASPTRAATFSVDTTLDGSDASPGDGNCATAAGGCTFRAAIQEANALAGGDLIGVPAGTFFGSFFEISSNVTIVGAGQGDTIIDGQSANSVIVITGGAVTMRDLTVQHGNSQGGGGVFVDDGTVLLEDVTIDDNFGFSGGGGMAINDSATVTMRRSTISNNNATGFAGGGVWNRGTLLVHDSLIVGNDSNRAGAIHNSTVGILNLRNTTVSGNNAHSPSAGTGGINNLGFAFFNNATITKNTGVVRGGGIQTVSGATTVMKNSIVAENVGISGPDDCFGELTSDSRYNLIGNSDGCVFTGLTTTFILDTDPQIFALANNGGPTLTHLLSSLFSPAINAGAPVQPGGPAADACEALDARGVTRLVCDMGAVEIEVTVPLTLLVDTTDDEVDSLPGDGTCATASGACSLRAAVQESNRLPLRQTIDVPDGEYTLVIPSAGESGIDPAAAGDLDLTDEVTIEGNGSATVVDGNGLSRVFEVLLVDADISSLTIRNGNDGIGGGVSNVGGDLTLTNVVVEDNEAGTSGGGVSSSGLDERLTISDSVIRNNTAVFSGGGGIRAGGELVVVDSEIAANVSGGSGGGIDASGTITLTRVAVSDNATLGPLGNGGGISAFGMTLIDSTVSGNMSSSHGGGLFGSGSTILNSTISGNHAGTRGGGLSTSGQLDVTHATVTDNTAAEDGDGLLIFGSTAAVALENTIVFNPGSGDECVGIAPPTSLGGNVAGDASCGLSEASDQPTTDPQLGALTDNGGPTLTHLPQSASPAIDAAPDVGIALDQRGVVRPQGGGFDSGAVETGAFPPDPPPGGMGFVLVDADADVDLVPVVDGDVLDATALPTNPGIRVEVVGDVGSVVFDFDGTVGFRTENAAPYSLGGDVAGDFNGIALGVGSHTVTATSFSGSGGSGDAGTALTITFEVAGP